MCGKVPSWSSIITPKLCLAIWYAPLPILLSKVPGNASMLGWATQVTQHSTQHNGQGWGHSMELKWLWGGQIWVTIITTGRLCHIMWSRNWRNLPPQTSSKCFPKKMKHPKETSCYIFRLKCPPPSLANQKFCAVTRALQPHYQEKSNSIGLMSHYPREQAERSRFCQVDPTNVSSCVWLGLAWLGLACPGPLGLLGKSAKCVWSFAL